MRKFAALIAAIVVALTLTLSGCRMADSAANAAPNDSTATAMPSITATPSPTPTPSMTPIVVPESAKPVATYGTDARTRALVAYAASNERRGALGNLEIGMVALTNRALMRQFGDLKFTKLGAAPAQFAQCELAETAFGNKTFKVDVTACITADDTLDVDNIYKFVLIDNVLRGTITVENTRNIPGIEYSKITVEDPKSSAGSWGTCYLPNLSDCDKGTVQYAADISKMEEQIANVVLDRSRDFNALDK